MRGLYFKSSIRKNPATGHLDGYYRLVESYRNMEGRVCHRTLLQVGFLPGVSPEQLNKVQEHLNNRYQKQGELFEETDPVVKGLTEDLWGRLMSEKRIDTERAEKAARMVNVDTLRHSHVREVGAEWMSYTIWNQLQLSEFLETQGWGQPEIQLAATQVISRAVYPGSELKTSRWIKENSAVCELTGYDMNHITKDKLYSSALKLYGIKDKLEEYLSTRTNHLFDLEDKIILYDLTNTYFEGRKQNSQLAQYGRSKEKRKDAKLVVLAMVVNIEGFIKYTAIHEGNLTDCKTLAAMIEKLSAHTTNPKAIIVLDAGIATEENLTMIKSKGYHYVCVSRTKIKDYKPYEGRLNVLLETKSGQDVLLKAVHIEKQSVVADNEKLVMNHGRPTDYYLEVTSPAKAKKEQGIKDRFEQRFEEELQKIYQAIHRKGGTKKAEKVYLRLGKAKQKYPSIQAYYNIEISIDDKTNKATGIWWEKDRLKEADRQHKLGVYFLRTDLNMADEVVIWNIYNTIREIESSFRCLKTDLDLRPIYHQKDDSTMAHLHLGILAYWIVNTMRYQFKAKGIHHQWKEIVRIGNTQKVITTTGQNTFDKIISVRRCSEPTEKLKQLLDILKAKPQPFRKLKSVVHKPALKKIEMPYLRYLPPG